MLKNRHFPKGIIHGFCPKIILFLTYFFLDKQVGKDHFLILWIAKKIIFRPENCTVKKCQERHISRGLVHGLCPKIEFLFIWVFWNDQVRKDFFFHILDRRERFLDLKINVSKSAKK